MSSHIKSWSYQVFSIKYSISGQVKSWSIFSIKPSPVIVHIQYHVKSCQAMVHIQYQVESSSGPYSVSSHIKPSHIKPSHIKSYHIKSY